MNLTGTGLLTGPKAALPPDNGTSEGRGVRVDSIRPTLPGHRDTFATAKGASEKRQVPVTLTQTRLPEVHQSPLPVDRDPSGEDTNPVSLDLGWTYAGHQTFHRAIRFNEPLSCDTVIRAY